MPGVYLSYPFCAQKCTYCNFASGVFPQELEARYLDALDREVRAYDWQWRPETVFLGGGTPSSIDPEALAQLLAAIPGRPWTEATLEAAPGTIRGDLGMSIQANLVHASDSLETAEKEVPRFFSKNELYDYDYLMLPYLYTRKERGE